jgi:hypothetical protein
LAHSEERPVRALMSQPALNLNQGELPLTECHNLRMPCLGATDVVFSEVTMRAFRTVAAVLFATAVAVAGCTAQFTHGSPPPVGRIGPTSDDADRQAAVYPVVLRQYLTSGHGHDGGDAGFGGYRFPRIFVLDRTVARTGAHMRMVNGEDKPIPSAVQHTVTETLADVGPVTFVASPNTVIEETDGCAQVRDEGILITLAPLVGMGNRAEVGVNGFVACHGASSVTYALERTNAGWVVHDTTQGAVS